MARTNKFFSFELHKGDSKKTVPACKKLKEADFAYIDGGHSYETVKADWENVKDHVPVVVFDDYFSKDKNGNLPKEEHLGVNKLMSEIEAYGKVVLPSSDGVLGGGRALSVGDSLGTGWVHRRGTACCSGGGDALTLVGGRRG